MSGDAATLTVAEAVDGDLKSSLNDETEGALAVLQQLADPPSSHTLQDWADIVVSTLAGEGVSRGTLEVFLVDEQRIAELNFEHMGKQGPTDVLAFPIDGPESNVESPVDGRPEQGSMGDPTECHLGDVVICPSIANTQAAGHAGSFDAELTLLLVHGVLHILGYDHYEAEQAAAMRSAEQRYLVANGFLHPGAPTESDPE